ncbi:hypothetical protein [Hyalangium gracile]|uniref:hypothetical protein n=1 Tax=Hyalangium gracile TaxID=394092 RepID=UPI001CCD031C|nr:hypothetical protein [Hyalangium gracile]
MRETTETLATKFETTHRVGLPGVGLLLAALAAFASACGPQDEAGTPDELSIQAQAIDDDDDSDDRRRPPRRRAATRWASRSWWRTARPPRCA